MAKMSTPKLWHALCLICGPEAHRVLGLARRWGGVSAIFAKNESQLLKAGAGPSLTRRIIAEKHRIDPEHEWRRLQSLGISAISWDDQAYPPRLREIPSPPPLLYVKGDPGLLAGRNLAVVGSRRLSRYGRQAVAALVPGLVRLGANIVSGLAVGADEAALACCLESGGRPVAVLASGLSKADLAGRPNWRLAERIAESGCLVSEIPPGWPVHKRLFPQRNRIVSGLSLGVLVVEAAAKSGSLITARLALEQNREVFAVPGGIFSPLSAGALDLIRRGAKCTLAAQDVADELNWQQQPGGQLPLPQQLEEPLGSLLGALSQGRSGLPDLLSATGLNPSQALAALTRLELLGLVKNQGGIYVKIN